MNESSISLNLHSLKLVEHLTCHSYYTWPLFSKTINTIKCYDKIKTEFSPLGCEKLPFLQGNHIGPTLAESSNYAWKRCFKAMFAMVMRRILLWLYFDCVSQTMPNVITWSDTCKTGYSIYSCLIQGSPKTRSQRFAFVGKQQISACCSR